MERYDCVTRSNGVPRSGIICFVTAMSQDYLACTCCKVSQIGNVSLISWRRPTLRIFLAPVDAFHDERPPDYLRLKPPISTPSFYLTLICRAPQGIQDVSEYISRLEELVVSTCFIHKSND